MLKFLQACFYEHAYYKSTPTFLLGKWEENLVDPLQMVSRNFAKPQLKFQETIGKLAVYRFAS